MINSDEADTLGNYAIAHPPSCIQACEATDIAIGRIRDACAEHGYVLMVTAGESYRNQGTSWWDLKSFEIWEKSVLF